MRFTVRLGIHCQITDPVELGLRNRRFTAPTGADLNNPSQAYTDRHDATVAALTPTARATPVVAIPSTANNNARARNTSRCAAVALSATPDRISRCSVDMSRAAVAGRISHLTKQ